LAEIDEPTPPPELTTIIERDAYKYGWNAAAKLGWGAAMERGPGYRHLGHFSPEEGRAFDQG